MGNFRISKSEAVLRVQTLPFPPPKKVGGQRKSFLPCPSSVYQKPHFLQPPRALLFTRRDTARPGVVEQSQLALPIYSGELCFLTLRTGPALTRPGVPSASSNECVVLEVPGKHGTLMKK